MSAALPLGPRFLEQLQKIRSLVRLSSDTDSAPVTLKLSNSFTTRVASGFAKLEQILTESATEAEIREKMTERKKGGILTWFALTNILTDPRSYIGMELNTDYFRKAAAELMTVVDAAPGEAESYETSEMKLQFQAFVDSLVAIEHAIDVYRDAARTGEILSIQLLGVSRNYGIALSFLRRCEEFCGGAAEKWRAHVGEQRREESRQERENRMRAAVPQYLSELDEQLATVERFLRVYNGFWELVREVYALNNELSKHFVFETYKEYFECSKDRIRAAAAERAKVK